MGRSQVLYNRTKGRYKSRGVQQQLQQQQQQQQGSSQQPGQQQQQQQHCTAGRGGRHHAPSRPQAPRTTLSPQPQPPTKYRPKLDESQILLQLESSNNRPIYTSLNSKPLDEVSGSIFDAFGANNSIDVSSMAATLTTTLKVSQRLRVPPHVAQALFQEDIILEPLQEEEKVQLELEEQQPSSSPFKPHHLRRALDPNSDGIMGEAAPLSPADTTVAQRGAKQKHKKINQVFLADDASYSVFGNRVRIGSDGNVEVRTATKPYNTKIGDTALVQATSASSGEDLYDYFAYDANRPVESSSYEGELTVGQQDRYSVATSSQQSTRDGRPKQPTKKKSTAAAAPIQESGTDLDHWLDEAMMSNDYAHGGVRLIPSKIMGDDQQQPLLPPDDGGSSSSMSTMTRSTYMSTQQSQVYTVGIPEEDEESRHQKKYVMNKKKNKVMAILPPQLLKQAEKQNKKGGEDLDAWLDSVIS